MKYRTKGWTLEGFTYDPYGEKPEWFLGMIRDGKAFEYPKAKVQYCDFGDKRDSHKAYVGDFVYRDAFGRCDVWSAKTYAQRCEVVKD